MINLLVILGPTASGKTAFAAQLAHRLNGEVISADSRQVYRRMNLGTGKDYQDYRIGNQAVPVHLIDIVDPGEHYHVFAYQQDFFQAWQDILNRDKLPVLCGGSGLYINAVTQPYQMSHVPENPSLRDTLGNKSLEDLSAMLASMRQLHNTTDTEKKERAIRAIEIEVYLKDHAENIKTQHLPAAVFIGIRYERSEERKRITARLHDRLSQGMINEVESLIESGVIPHQLMYYGLEYKFITQYLLNKMSYDEMVSRLNTAIHQYAKKQMTWFRKMEREGTTIHWIEGHLPMEDKISHALGIIRL